MLVFLAILLRILSNPIANVFQKRLTLGGLPALTVNAMSYTLLSVFCIVLALSVGWASLPASFWLWATVAGVFGAVGNGFLVKALERGDLSILGPINSYKSIVGMVVGVVLIGEKPSLTGLLGVVVIIFGSYFVFETTEEGFTWALLRNQEIRYRIYAMVLTAIEAVFIKKVILLSDATTSFIVWCWFGALFAWMQVLATPSVRKKAPQETAASQSGKGLLGTAGLFLLLGLCIGTMQFTTNYVFRYIPVGYGLALFQLSTIVSVVLGYRLFHEKGIRKKLLGSVIMIIGSVLIIFST